MNWNFVQRTPILLGAAALIATLVVALGGGSKAASAAEPFAAITATPHPMTFDDVLPGGSLDQQIVVTSVGTTAATFDAIENIGRDASDFTIAQDTCSGKPLLPQVSCFLIVRFAPTVAGTRISNVRITGGNFCTYWVNLAGGGTTAAAARPRAVGACEVVNTTVPTPPTTVTTASPVQASAASTSAPAASPVPTASAVTATSPKRCTSRRLITLHVKPRAKTPIRRIVVQVNGRTVRTITSTTRRPIATTVPLRGFPKGQFTLRLKTTDVNGRTSTRVQRFLTCTRKS